MTKHEGYKMRTEKYVAHFLSPTDPTGIPIRARAIPSSGSPSAVWGLIKEHLNVCKDHPTSELKTRGWRVFLVSEQEAEAKPTPEPVLGKGLQDLIDERDAALSKWGTLTDSELGLNVHEPYQIIPAPEPKPTKLIHNPWLWAGLLLGIAIAGGVLILSI